MNDDRAEMLRQFAESGAYGEAGGLAVTQLADALLEANGKIRDLEESLRVSQHEALDARRYSDHYQTLCDLRDAILERVFALCADAETAGHTRVTIESVRNTINGDDR